MSQPLPSNEIEMCRGHPDLYMNKLEEILDTLDASDIGFFDEVDSKYPDEIKEERKNFPFCPVKRLYHLIDIKPDQYTQNKKFLCVWTEVFT